MAYKYYNPNPLGKSTGDCVIRAISKVLNQSWDKTYWELCEHGFQMGDWGDSNTVWDSYLRSNGFVRKVIPNTCPDCYTVGEFTKDYPHGVYLLSTGCGMIRANRNNWRDMECRNQIEQYYKDKMILKEKALINNNVPYLFLFQEDFDNNTFKEKTLEFIELNK